MTELQKEKKKCLGPVRESNPGPLAPKARIMPLDQQASTANLRENLNNNSFFNEVCSVNRSSGFFYRLKSTFFQSLLL